MAEKPRKGFERKTATRRIHIYSSYVEPCTHASSLLAWQARGGGQGHTEPQRLEPQSRPYLMQEPAPSLYTKQVWKWTYDTIFLHTPLRRGMCTCAGVLKETALQPAVCSLALHQHPARQCGGGEARTSERGSAPPSSRHVSAEVGWQYHESEAKGTPLIIPSGGGGEGQGHAKPKSQTRKT